MNTTEIKQALQAEASKHGFELVKADCRSNYFHIRRGTEVRSGGIWRGIDADSLVRVVKSTAVYGTRLDTMRDSLYFAA